MTSKKKYDITTAKGILAATAVGIAQPVTSPLGFLARKLATEKYLASMYGGLKLSADGVASNKQAAESLAKRGPLMWEQFQIRLTRSNNVEFSSKALLSTRGRWATWADLAEAVNDPEASVRKLKTEHLEGMARREQFSEQLDAIMAARAGSE